MTRTSSRMLGIVAMVLAGPLLTLGCSNSVTQGNTNAGQTRPHPDSGSGNVGLALGSPCTSNSACNSQLCGLNGTGLCCATACPSTSNVCAAVGCDDGGSCAYVPGATACGSQTCVGDVMTGPTCDGRGNCSAKSVEKCPGNFVCDDAGVACNAACASSAECDTGTHCNHGLCAPQVTAGPCSEADDCESGLCGVDGGAGHCCNHLCPATDALCGALDCDNRGACAYAGADVTCLAGGCSGSQVQGARSCDSAGNCASGSVQSCAPYQCASDSCPSTCLQTPDCALGAYCDRSANTCCPVPNGSTIYVDNVLGNDAAGCCGTDHTTACRTLTHVMQMIDAAQAQNVTIAVASTAPSWDMNAEQVPIRLGWGADLLLPGNAYFWGPSDGGARAIFEIGHFSASDPMGVASIVGGQIGELPNTAPSPTPSSILIDPGATLYAAQTNIFSSQTWGTTAIEVSAGGSLVLGADQARTSFGPVVIAGAAGQGWDGIVCDSDAGLGCTITDIGGASAIGGSVSIHNQANVDIDAEDFSNITLTSTPVVGPLLGQNPAYGLCTTKHDTALAGAAILLHGKATLTFENGHVACVAGTAFGLTASANGVPDLTIQGTTISNSDCALHAYAGTATVRGSNLVFNYNGVVQDTDGTNVATLNLADVDGGVGTNAIACNDLVESSEATAVPGVSVLNSTANPLDARNVSWDTAGPDTFDCAPGFTGCSCILSSCALAPGDDGMDAVSISTGAVLTDGSGTANVKCNGAAVCGGIICPGAQVCCFGYCC